MALILEAACGCDTGKLRKNNEDNFLFDSHCLEEQNNGLAQPLTLCVPLKQDVCVAVFDGMGGENFGETASYAAAECMWRQTQGRASFFVPDLESATELVLEMNDAVVAKARELCTDHMGTTLVALYFHRGFAYICNLGDSRGYRLRNGTLQQISVDHLEQRPASSTKKRPLTQHLGIPPEVIRLEPHIAKGELQRGDQFLLCSDGLTDMLSDSEIRAIMARAASAEQCVQTLIDSALERGGRDNVTVIVCRIN